MRERNVTRRRKVDGLPELTSTLMSGNSPLGATSTSDTDFHSRRNNDANRTAELQNDFHPPPRVQHDLGTFSIHNTAGSGPHSQLRVNEPGDQYEEEADRVAADVIASGTQNVPTASADPAAGMSQRSNGGGGRQLDPETRAYMEPRFGHDFGNVRLFVDSDAAASARSLDAHAYTLGTDIFMDSRHYSPGTESGKRLLAHELTHVVQQRGVDPNTRPSRTSHPRGPIDGKIQTRVVTPMIQRQQAVADPPQAAPAQVTAPTRFRPPAGVGGRKIGNGVIEDIGSTVALVQEIERILHPAFKAGGSQALATIRSAYSNDNVKQNATNMIQGTALVCGPFTGENQADNYRGDISVSASLGPLVFERADQAALTTASQSLASSSATGGITTGVQGTVGVQGTAGSGGNGAPSQSGQVSGQVQVSQQQAQASTAGMGGATTRTVAAPPGSVLFSTSLTYTITHTFHWDPGTGWSIASLGLVPLVAAFMKRDDTWGPYTAVEQGVKVRYPGLDCPPE